jgi:hypothetical protein
MALLVAVVLCAGCEFSLPGPPSEFPKAVVEGKITMDGKPLPSGGRGWVTFFPEGSSRGEVAVCRLEADGGYRCDHVPVGPVNVRIDVASIVAANISPIVRRRVSMLRGPASPLHVTTIEGAATRFDFDLTLSPDPPRT